MTSQAATPDCFDSPPFMAEEGVEPETQAMQVPLPDGAPADLKCFVCLPADNVDPPEDIKDLSLLPMLEKLSLGDDKTNTSSTTNVTNEVATVSTPQLKERKPRSIPWNQLSPNERRFPWIHKKTCPKRTPLTGDGSSADDSSSNSGKVRTDSSATDESSESSSREKAEMDKILNGMGIVSDYNEESTGTVTG